MIQLLTLSLLTYTACSQTKYFIGYYTVPLGDVPRMAYPIGKCVNYEATLDAEILFGKYRCINNGDTVTLTSYGVDPTCSNSVGDAIEYTMDNLSPGDLYSFSCTGDLNYAEINSCTTSDDSKTYAVGDDGGVRCCSAQLTDDDNAGCLSQLQSTEVCIKQGDGTYAMSSCDNSTAVTLGYESTDTTCSGTPTGTVTTQYYDFCSFYQQVPLVNFQVFRRAVGCYEADVDIAPIDSYCPYVTDDPTMTPSVNPTAVTKAPTAVTKNKDDQSAGNNKWYGIFYGVVLGVVVGIWM